jgi:hypothetical protein
MVQPEQPAHPSGTAHRSSLDEVEARLQAYHQVGFKEVLGAITYLRDEGDAVICGGSLTLGLGNRLSDLDIVVAGQVSAESSRIPLQHWVSSLRVDAWKLHRDALGELVERAEEALDAEGPIDGAFGDIFEEADLKLLHRVAFGILIDGTELRYTVSRSYEAIAGDLLVREYAERARSVALLAQIALAAGSWVAATSHARLAVRSALHASLYANGVAFTGDKWLRERIDAAAPALVDTHEIFSVLPATPDLAKTFTLDAVATVERLSKLDLSLAALAGQVQFDAGDLRLHAVGDRWFLVSLERDSLWELTSGEAETWRRVATKGPWSCVGDDEAAWVLSFDLSALGLTKMRWARGLPVAELAFDQVALT